ncbi:hypothetical protein BDV12DRAFT_191059 [Aspergillus spectabilis]
MSRLASWLFRDPIPVKPFIDGQFVETNGKDPLCLRSAVDDASLTDDIRCANAEDVDVAVKSAEKGLELWQALSLRDRQALLERFAGLIEENADHLGYLETIVTGKPISFSGHHEPRKAAAHIRCQAHWCTDYAGFVDKFSGEIVPSDDGLLQLVTHQPYGICAGINPFNSPMICFAMKAGPALATGSVIITKASEYNPLSTLYLGELATAAGIPAGVVNILVGEAECGEALSRHMKIREISFTGSITVGKKIQIAATQSNLKRVTLELGGKPPVLVFADRDLELAVQESSSFTKLNGQGCILGTRIYVHDSISDAHAATLQSDPLLPGTFSSPIFHHRRRDIVMDLLASGKEEATLLTGGSTVGSRGCYVRPTIYFRPTSSARVLREEIFGPVCVVDTFATEKEALQKANDTSFGLGAVVFTRDLGATVQVSSRLEAGTVTVNNTNYTDPGYPFGGWKDSGIGRENGRYVLEEYTQLKFIIVKYYPEVHDRSGRNMISFVSLD